MFIKNSQQESLPRSLTTASGVNLLHTPKAQGMSDKGDGHGHS